jgi:hypothetical protein
MRCVRKLKEETIQSESTRFTHKLKDATHLGLGITQMRPNVKIIDCFQEKKYAKGQVGYAVFVRSHVRRWVPHHLWWVSICGAILVTDWPPLFLEHLQRTRWSALPYPSQTPWAKSPLCPRFNPRKLIPAGVVEW